MWFIGVEVEQETSAPPPKKNPGSAPVFRLSCPSATFALQRGGFVPREWVAAKGLFSLSRDT